MAYILNIDTAITNASVCLSKDDELVNIAVNENLKDHAAWLQPAIKKLIDAAGIQLKDLDAVAVSNGPGSYTGLRIGLSTAKGLCYALNIPLIAIGTLDMMAAAAENNSTDLLCPMIDARRMEVFTAVYKKNREILIPPCAMILDEHSFSDLLRNNTILFFGNGSDKFKKLSIINQDNVSFENIETTSSSLIKISNHRFHTSNFDDIALLKPLYIKNFVVYQK
jgi:tRNA threonylcarbamoyladenosine biosynthesis protein TsaB